jgi:hypothetical protein
LGRMWQTLKAAQKTIVADLSDVTFIDETGKNLLANICRTGTSVVASGCLTRSIVDEIAEDCAKSQIRPADT